MAHAAPHTFASRLVMTGVDLKTVQELMGHEMLAMTAQYAHIAPTHKEQALKSLVRPGSVSVPSGYKMPTGAKKQHRARTQNRPQLIDSR